VEEALLSTLLHCSSVQYCTVPEEEGTTGGCCFGLRGGGCLLYCIAVLYNTVLYPEDEVPQEDAALGSREGATKGGSGRVGLTGLLSVGVLRQKSTRPSGTVLYAEEGQSVKDLYQTRMRDA